MHFAHVTAVWGQDYLWHWLNVTLPLQLSPGNLGSARAGDVFAVYTDATLEAPILDQVRRLMTVNIHVMPCHEDNAHAKMNYYHDAAMKRYAGPDTTLVWLSPDVVYADGAFACLRRKIGQGFRAVSVPMFRVQRLAMVGALATEGIGRYGRDGIGRRRLVAMSLDRLHPMTEALFWDAERFFMPWPSNIYFRAPSGIRGHCWHQQPMATRLDGTVPEGGTLDVDLIARAGIKEADICIIQDSDDLCAVEMTSISQFVPHGEWTATTEGLAQWAKTYAGPIDKCLFRTPTSWHAQDIDSSWAEVDEFSHGVVEEVLELAARPVKLRILSQM